MHPSSSVIVAARRTPIGAFQGHLGSMRATELGALAAAAALQDASVSVDDVDQANFGCVLTAGIGQAPARQAALMAGLTNRTPCLTVNKVCGSGMKALMLADEAIRAGNASILLAGGMESMSNSPYLLPKARSGYRIGHHQVLDHMMFDGLQNASDGQSMGNFADITAARYGFSRAEQDDFAIASFERSRHAAENGYFDAEIVPVVVSTTKTKLSVSSDECPNRGDTAKIPHLRPAFSDDGTITAASSSSIADGAAVLIVMAAEEARRRSVPVLARIVGQIEVAQEPEWFTTAPILAVRALLDHLNWTQRSVDLYEVNEAFACVTMAAMHDLGIEHSRMNVSGGACALGHPIGASGARLLVTLVHALRRRGGGRGIAALCIGGGEATAVAIEV